MRLVQIPALGCDAGLYREFDDSLPAGQDTQTIIAVGDRMAGCVAQVLAQAPPEFVVFGTSFGARVALEATLAAPHRVKGLIISGSGPGPVADQAGGLRRSARVRGDEFEAVLNEVGAIISHLPGPRGPEASQAFRAMSRAMGAENFATQSDAMAHRIDLWPRLHEIQCPVLCLWGDHDHFAGADVGRKIAASVPYGQCSVMKDCGHFPTLEYPVEAAKIIAAWLALSGL